MLGAVALALFLAMWLLALDLRQLQSVAWALLANVVLQMALLAALLPLVFRAMGRDHDAAVMSGGFTGFMLGTTATALAVMRALAGRAGPAQTTTVFVRCHKKFFFIPQHAAKVLTPAPARSKSLDALTAAQQKY